MHRAARAFSCLWLALAPCCGGARRTGPNGSAAPTPSTSTVQREDSPYPVRPATFSPQSARPPLGDFARDCPVRDGALDRAAAYVADREVRGRPALDADELKRLLRAEGAPYVWPELWSLEGTHLGESAADRFASWLRSRRPMALPRCGTARASARGREVAVAVVVDAVADLDPLPTEARLGTWLDVTAHVHVPATTASVIVLGPRGRPQTLLSSFDDGLVRARVHADDPGRWLVQVLASVEGGPRPVAEALVFAGESAEFQLREPPAPGERRDITGDPATQLVEMVNVARRGEGLEALGRDASLDRIAQAHAEAMRLADALSHDAGDGPPDERVVEAGYRATLVGENVAHAADPRSAHRALWESPSHRSNLLEPGFDALGVGIARDRDDTIWVCEVFAGTAARPTKSHSTGEGSRVR